MQRTVITTASLALLLALPACGDDGGGTMTASQTDPTSEDTGDSSGDSSGGSSGDESSTGEPTTGEPGVLSFAADVYGPILSARCGCHIPGPSGTLAMGADAASAYAAIVGMPSGIGMNFVTAGDSSMSYLFHKVNGTQVEAGGGGGQMPLGGMLTDPEIATIKAWIDGGALP